MGKPANQQETKSIALRISEQHWEIPRAIFSEVTQPETVDFTNGTSVRYAYDANHRLISITDAKGQKYLVNHYATLGKAAAQDHGSGVFKISIFPQA